jgi:hypothetical protein
VKKLFIIFLTLALASCAHWDQLEPAEKVAVAVVVAAVIIAESSDSQSQCISTRSLETGCGAQ